MSTFQNEYLQQIFASREQVEISQQTMLKNIFNIYDYDGDGHLNEEEYLTFISDIVYISVLMNRIPESEYHLENVSKIARWSSSNFKNNLFRVPLPSVSYELFMDGIIYALTENRNFPIFPNNNIFVISFVPELIHYFHYYVAVAKRRGWPTELEEQNEEIEQNEQNEENEENEQNEQNETMDVSGTTFENQMVDYQEIRRKKYQAEKEQERIKHQQELLAIHEEQDRVNREIHAQNQRLEAEQRERERRNLAEENRQRQLLAIQQLQANLRNHIRQAIIHQEDVDALLPDIGTVDVKEDDEGYEPIEGNVNVLEFIKNNPGDGLVFRCGDSYYLASKNRIRSMILSGERDNSLFYGCMCEIDDDWTQPQTWALLEQAVIPYPVYYNIQQLGIPIRYVYLDEIKRVLAGSHSYYSIEKPEDYDVIPSFASDNVLNHGVGSMSGLHCQEGQMDVVYRIKRFTVTAL